MPKIIQGGVDEKLLYSSYKTRLNIIVGCYESKNSKQIKSDGQKTAICDIFCRNGQTG